MCPISFLTSLINQGMKPSSTSEKKLQNITVSLDLNLIRLIHIEKRDIYMYKERHVTVSFGLSVKGRK